MTKVKRTTLVANDRRKKLIDWAYAMNILTALMILLLLFAQPLIADDECNFDQQNQIEVLRRLQSKYEKSKLAEEERTLTIERGKSTIYFQRGGCEHLGISIKYRTKDNRNFNDQNALFDQAEKLIEEFGQEFIKIDEIKKLITDKKYKLLQENNPRIYAINYKHLSYFEITFSESEGYKIIEVSYYV